MRQQTTPGNLNRLATIARITLATIVGAAATTAAGAAQGWTLGEPAAHVTDPAALSRTSRRIGAMDGVYSVLVAHRGELIMEEYFREGTRSKPHNMKSASKSLLSALVGIAIAEAIVTRLSEGD